MPSSIFFFLPPHISSDGGAEAVRGRALAAAIERGHFGIFDPLEKRGEISFMGLKFGLFLESGDILSSPHVVLR